MRRRGLLPTQPEAGGSLIAPRPRDYGRRPTLRQRFAGVLTADSLLRLLLALVLAMALWLYVNSHDASNVVFTYPQAIPVTAENVPPGLTVSNVILPIHIQLPLGAQGLPAIGPSSVLATVDLGSYGPGLHTRVPVTLTHDPSVSIVGYSPHLVTVNLERLVSRRVRVSPSISSHPPFGFALQPGSMHLDPQFVRIQGPRGLVQEVARATVSVPLDQARTSVNAVYAPVLETSQGGTVNGRITVAPATVRVRAGIRQLFSYKALPVIPEPHGEPAVGYAVDAIQVSPSLVTVYGPPRILSALSNISTQPVWIHGQAAGTRSVHVRLRIPLDVVVPGTRQVLVTLGVAPVVGTASTSVSVVPSSIAAGGRATISPQSVRVTVMGPAPRLTSIGAALQASVSLANLTPGTYVLKPRIQFPVGVHVVSVTPQTVTVVLHSSRPG